MDTQPCWRSPAGASSGRGSSEHGDGAARNSWCPRGPGAQSKPYPTYSSLSLLAFQRVGILTGRMALTQPPSVLVSPGQGQRKSGWREVSADPALRVLCVCLGTRCGDGAQSAAHRDLLLHSQGTESSVGRLGIRNTCFGVYRDQAREMNSVLPAGTTWSCGGGLGEALGEVTAGTRGRVAELRSLHRMYHTALLFQPLHGASL